MGGHRPIGRAARHHAPSRHAPRRVSMPASRPAFGSVNWQSGMFLTPDHFLHQEAYTDTAALWALRFTSAAMGLVGGGPRELRSENRDGVFNPQLDIDASQDP